MNLRSALNRTHSFYCPKCERSVTRQDLAGLSRNVKCCTDVDRFWMKVNKTDTCWLWLGFLNHDGYGRVGPLKGVHTGMRAHKMAWQLAHGPVPPGLELMHTCDVRACVNPGHLRLGTHAENMADMTAKGRGPKGEDFPDSIMTEEKVLEMRKRREKTGEPYHVLGQAFGISMTQARAICLRIQWRHVQ